MFSILISSLHHLLSILVGLFHGIIGTLQIGDIENPDCKVCLTDANSLYS